METTLNSRFTITPQRLFLVIFFIILFFLSFFSFPKDDGLRHVGVALDEHLTWKDVYPYSYFSEYSNYSPWFGYDLILKKSLKLLRNLPIQSSTLKFFFIKFFSFILVLLVFWVIIIKSKIIQEINNFGSFLLAAICVFTFLTPFFLRSIIVRPFVFGSVFIILSIGASGYWRGSVYAAILIFLYPYLSWFYIIPVAFCHFFLGNKKFCGGILTVLFAFLILQDPSFWKLQLGIFSSASVREKMGMNISELSFTLNSFYCIFILITITLCYPISHTETRKMNFGDLLLAVYFLPSIMYFRTFVDILSPIAFVIYSRSIILFLKSVLPNILEPWKLFSSNIISSIFTRMPSGLIVWLKNRTFKEQSGISLKPLLSVLYGILILFLVKINIDQLKNVNETEKFLSIIPKNSTILCSFNQQYNILFVRPDLKIIPSSEVGMPSPKIRNEYIDFFKLGLFRSLASKTSANYLIEARDMYLNPTDTRHLELIGNQDKLSIWKILSSPN
jgi:hypothetical protein